MTGCASPTSQRTAVDQALLVDCEEPEDLKGFTGADTLKALTSWGSAFRECADLHKKLVKAVKPP